MIIVAPSQFVVQEIISHSKCINYSSLYKRTSSFVQKVERGFLVVYLYNFTLKLFKCLWFLTLFGIFFFRVCSYYGHKFLFYFISCNKNTWTQIQIQNHIKQPISQCRDYFRVSFGYYTKFCGVHAKCDKLNVKRLTRCFFFLTLDVCQRSSCCSLWWCFVLTTLWLTQLQAVQISVRDFANITHTQNCFGLCEVFCFLGVIRRCAHLTGSSTKNSSKFYNNTTIYSFMGLISKKKFCAQFLVLFYIFFPSLFQSASLFNFSNYTQKRNSKKKRKYKKKWWKRKNKRRTKKII